MATAFTLCAQEQKMQVTGKQIKTEDNEIRLKCNSINLRHDASIKEIRGGSAGFWISGKYGKIKEFRNTSEAVGFALSPGIYWVYPHLEQNSDEASVTVKFRQD